MSMSTRNSAATGAIAAFVALFILLLGTVGAAHAEERHFCYGANVSPGTSCSSGNWNMNAGFANSSDGTVCLQIPYEGFYNCGPPNSGVYLSGGCAYGHATIFNWTGNIEKVYGVFWTC
ncbi:MAG TPA: hypothetical protein VFL77_11120 [Solirubrobacterales bacterium]|nr:hypothetical protein [Solirubrobacterales bacterium]